MTRALLIFSFSLMLVWINLACNKQITASGTSEIPSFQYLALGDSYTIGESVDSLDTYPEHLKAIYEEDGPYQNIEVKIVAKTGWTTADLLKALDQEELENKYDLVTLLIGVNNQYQGKPFLQYKQEFDQLLKRAIELSENSRARVVVVSIPDYAFTPFGQTRPTPVRITTEINRYNEFAARRCKSLDVRFINITDITRKGLADHSLVASDKLHPSGMAYRLFAERIASQTDR